MVERLDQVLGAHLCLLHCLGSQSMRNPATVTEDGIRKVPAASSCSICFFRFVASSFVGKTFPFVAALAVLIFISVADAVRVAALRNICHTVCLLIKLPGRATHRNCLSGHGCFRLPAGHGIRWCCCTGCKAERRLMASIRAISSTVYTSFVVFRAVSRRLDGIGLSDHLHCSGIRSPSARTYSYNYQISRFRSCQAEFQFIGKPPYILVMGDFYTQQFLLSDTFGFIRSKSFMRFSFSCAFSLRETPTHAGDWNAHFHQVVVDAGMSCILWVSYLAQRQVGGDDQRLPAAVSAVHDVVDLLQCILGATLHAEVINNKQGIAAEPVHNIIAPGKAVVQLVQDPGEVRHTYRHLLLHQSVCNAPGKETLAGAYPPQRRAQGSLRAWSAIALHSGVRGASVGCAHCRFQMSS